jgi:hypothetical protein
MRFLILLLLIVMNVSTSQAGVWDRFVSRLRPTSSAQAKASRAVGAAGPQCSELFLENVIPDPVYPYVKRTATAEKFLSEGYSAHVYLMPSIHGLFIKKMYKETEFGTNRFHYDIEGLHALHELHSAFRVVEGERYMEPSLSRDELPRPAARLKFVEGRTVHALLTDADVSPEVKAQVSNLYSHKLADLKHKLEASGDLKDETTLLDSEVRYFFDGHLDGMKMLRAESRTGGPLLIKTDNVIVDPYDLSRMTIVDPY